MNSEKSKSINEIFDERKKFIPEVGEQLREKSTSVVEVAGQELQMDYRRISIAEKKIASSESVLLLPGFGSGREGITELGFSLACEGREVILPSLPGYGDSQNPTKEYYDTDNFDNEAEAMNQFLKQLNVKGRVHLIGHSMGSEILARLAEMNPDGVASLTLLNPAGVEESENTLALAAKFGVVGPALAKMESLKYALDGNHDYQEELYDHIDSPESPFSKARLPQRIAEIKKISKGQLLGKLRNLDENLSVNYITGGLDTVYPPGKEDDETSQISRVVSAINNKDNINVSVMKGLRHNTTLAPDEITAANISHWLDKAESSRK